MKDEPSKFSPYLDQLKARAAELRLDLADVCAAEGIAPTTLARWRKGEANCREGTAQALFRRMDEMVSRKAGPAAGIRRGIPAGAEMRRLSCL